MFEVLVMFHRKESYSAEAGLLFKTRFTFIPVNVILFSSLCCLLAVHLQ